MKKRFNEKEVPFVKRLENALQEIGVQRQQYFGGAFVGNHFHKALKVEYTTQMHGLYTNESARNIFQLPNIKKLCNPSLKWFYRKHIN